MALKPGFLLLLLWNLSLSVCNVTSWCNVTCSTDYTESLNCSCADSVPTHSVVLEVICKHSDEDLTVNDTCEVTPPQSWCVMRPKELSDVASIGTNCTARASQQGDQVISSLSTSSFFSLSDVVKPQPPFNLQVANTEEFYNLTWEHDNQIDCLMYMLHIRETKDSSKDPLHSVLVEGKNFLLDKKQLQPNVYYTAHVKAKLCPEEVYVGPWSEWSSSAEWRTAGGAEEEAIAVTGLMLVFYVGLPLMFAMALVALGIKLNTKLKQMIKNIPKPDEFFEPLYSTYGGNFKGWVKPVFSEYDFLRTGSGVQMTSEKQYDVPQYNNNKQTYKENSKMAQQDGFLSLLQPYSDSLAFFQDGSSSQGTSHSTGHISIHTVTLSGEEGFEDEVGSQSSVNAPRSFRVGGNIGLIGQLDIEQAGYDLEDVQVARLNRYNRVLLHHENLAEEHFLPHVPFIEPERVSLDSLALNEQLEDPYPPVDFDTIDSGFGECSSPGASDTNGGEQIDSDSLHDHKTSNSNYVKQWMARSTAEED